MVSILPCATKDSLLKIIEFINEKGEDENRKIALGNYLIKITNNCNGIITAGIPGTSRKAFSMPNINLPSLPSLPSLSSLPSLPTLIRNKDNLPFDTNYKLSYDIFQDDRNYKEKSINIDNITIYKNINDLFFGEGGIIKKYSENERYFFHLTDFLNKFIKINFDDTTFEIFYFRRSLNKKDLYEYDIYSSKSKIINEKYFEEFIKTKKITNIQISNEGYRDKIDIIIDYFQNEMLKKNNDILSKINYDNDIKVEEDYSITFKNLLKKYKMLKKNHFVKITYINQYDVDIIFLRASDESDESDEDGKIDLYKIEKVYFIKYKKKDKDYERPVFETKTEKYAINDEIAGTITNQIVSIAISTDANKDLANFYITNMENILVKNMSEIQTNNRHKEYEQREGRGGRGKKFSSTYSKEILGKKRCIYKVLGSKKEHVKYKGSFITLTEYKKLLKPIQSKIKR